MITELTWCQNVNAAIGEFDFAVVGFINPRPRFYIIVSKHWHLCHVRTDGNNEAEDIANAKTLCRLHYQHSFSEDK